jgi:hypothetical protein
MDMVVEQQVVIEVKSVLKLDPIFTAQPEPLGGLSVLGVKK